MIGMQRAALFALLVSACPTTPPKDASLRSPKLQDTCSSSSECTHNTNGCTYCYGGHCSCTLPAEPIPGAGIDAAQGGTTP